MTQYLTGDPPPLLRNGSFRVAAHPVHAKRLVLHPPDLSGRRIAKRKPEQIVGEKAVFSMDTAKDGAAIFYEIPIVHILKCFLLVGTEFLFVPEIGGNGGVVRIFQMPVKE